MPSPGTCFDQFQADNIRCQQAAGPLTPGQAATQPGAGTLVAGTALGAGAGAFIGSTAGAAGIAGTNGTHGR